MRVKDHPTKDRNAEGSPKIPTEGRPDDTRPRPTEDRPTEGRPTEGRPVVILVNLAFWGCVVIWSTSPLAIKWSAVGMGFIYGVFFRMLIGVTFSFIILKIMRIPIEWNKQAIRAYAAAAIGIYGAMVLVYWGSQFIPSGLVSVIFGCAPLLTSFLAHFILKEDSLTWKKILSISIGVGGLAIIFLFQSTFLT